MIVVAVTIPAIIYLDHLFNSHLEVPQLDCQCPVHHQQDCHCLDHHPHSQHLLDHFPMLRGKKEHGQLDKCGSMREDDRAGSEEEEEEGKAGEALENKHTFTITH
jgi:hypothetical protein